MKAALVAAETLHMRRAALVTTLALAVTAGSAAAYPLPGAGNSSAIVGSIGAALNLHADFGSGLWDGGPIGIPITVVGSSTAKRVVRFEYAGESDPGPYPIPS